MKQELKTLAADVGGLFIALIAPTVVVTVGLVAVGFQ